MTDDEATRSLRAREESERQRKVAEDNQRRAAEEALRFPSVARRFTQD